MKIIRSYEPGAALKENLLKILDHVGSLSRVSEKDLCRAGLCPVIARYAVNCCKQQGTELKSR